MDTSNASPTPNHDASLSRIVYFCALMKKGFRGRSRFAKRK